MVMESQDSLHEYDDLKNLDKIDWEIVYSHIWKDDVENMTDNAGNKQSF